MSGLRWRLDTLRRMRPRQLTCRLRRRWRQRYLYPKRGPELFPWPGILEESDETVPFDERRAAQLRPRQELLDRADALVERRFTYLGLPTEDLGEPADWQRAPLLDPLWQYNLHYGQWVVDLIHAFLITEDRRYRGTCIELVEDWLEGNPVGRQPAWEPYPICRRVVAWSRIAGVLAEGSSIGRRFFHRRVEPSLRQQAAFLEANLEYDVPNNHLIANFKALVWLGLLFPHWPESESWRQLGLEGLWQEMRGQVLADGVHEERSLSYHCIVLQDLLEVRWLAASRGVHVPPDVDLFLGRMLVVLEAIRAPGGHWPMIADSVPGYPLDPQSLLLAASQIVPGIDIVDGGAGDDAWYVGWLGGDPEHHATGETSGASPGAASSRIFPRAGWAVLRDDRDGHLFFDGGDLGPSHILGHAHADALSFELYGGGRPLLVDPGVCTYRAGEQRDRFRSTAVHNTVTVDDQDQCHFWGPFRVAFPPSTGLESESGKVSVHGWHDGYQRLAEGVTHHRYIHWQPPRGPVADIAETPDSREGAWIIRDRLSGEGSHRFRSTLQLAPGAKATARDESGEAHWPGGIGVRLQVLESQAPVVLEVEPGEVSPSWNDVESAPRWVLTWQDVAPSEVVFRVSIVRPSVQI